MPAKQDTQTPPQIDFLIQKIFISDASFETPSAPEVFKTEWKPDINVELDSGYKKLKDDQHVIDLTVTVTAKNQNKIAFVAEVKQSGIFTIKGADKAQLDHIIGAYCPDTLFPYARESISGMMSRGGFPPVTLNPINFDAVYAQKVEAEAAAKNNQKN